MAHYHASKKDKKPKASSKKVKCCICGTQDIEARMKREPPERGGWVCPPPKPCRTEKKERDNA